MIMNAAFLMKMTMLASIYYIYDIYIYIYDMYMYICTLYHGARRARDHEEDTCIVHEDSTCLKSPHVYVYVHLMS
eukprot:jgi/Botrbrau1/8152/Bobra.357_2s0001.2